MSCSRRQGDRVKSYEKCVLHHNGRNLVCFLEDISTSGVLVNCYDISLETLKQGDICTINLSDDPKVSHREIRCSVARLTSTQVGLQFTY